MADPEISFLDLTPLEKRLVASAAAGAELDCAPGGGTTGDDLGTIDDWDERVIRAHVLVALCAGDRPAWTVHRRRGLRLTGANVVGALDLRRAELAGRSLDFRRCRFADGIVLTEAHVGSLSFISCDVEEFTAYELESAAKLVLRGSRMKSLILTDARIQHALDCSAARIENKNGPAFSCDQLSATGLTLRDAEIAGEVRLHGAHISGDIDCARARIANDNGTAFSGDQLSAARVYLVDAEIAGEVRLVLAQIGGELDCSDAKIANKKGRALSAGGLSAAAVLLSNAEIVGEVRLIDAQIGGELDCSDAKIANPKGPALSGSRSSAAAVFLKDAEITGEVRLLAAQIGSQLNCSCIKITNQNGPAFSGDQLSAKGVFLRNAEITGEVRLLNAQISQLDCTGANITNKNGPALVAQGLHVRGALLFRPRHPPVGEVDFTNADVGSLTDELRSWPRLLRLTGFTFRSLDSKDRDPDQRLEWIRRSEPFSPAPYNQLHSLYQRSGEDRFARTIAITREHDRRTRGDLGRWSSAWNWFLGITVAHGYRPHRALWGLLLFVVIGSALFSLAVGTNAMAPTDARIQARATSCTATYPCFNPVVYTLDVLLPVIDFHQESNWLPSPSSPYGPWYLVLTWALIAIGWLLTTSVVAGIASVWRRE